MNQKLQEILTKYITRNYSLTSEILANIDEEANNLTEIIGENGVGKFYILKNLYKELEKRDKNFELYQPYIFKL
ncbi:MAG: hypothetical protein SVM86_04970, partial [Candidatus Cloacimonadota bacterium]|nr:hypothetical protein [Candidatus Cloacimonadota bacterium]